MTQALTTRALSGEYTIDADNSRIGFHARYAMVSTVHGSFGTFDADIRLNGDEPERSSASVRIYTDSINTGQAQRDEHLRSPDFLDTETYPEIRFTSTGIRVTGPDCFEMSGQLTIRDTTRPVAITFTLTGTSTDHRGLALLGFAGSATLSRADFGMRWNAVLETGGVLVSDDIGLDFDIALTRANLAPPAEPRTDRRRLAWPKRQRTGR